MQRDDGVVVHLNGSEVFRDNMPAGAIGYLTPAATTTGDETGFYPSAVNSGYLLSGTNVIAVEIHQAGGGSSDISFNFELTGVQSYLAPAITTQPQSQTLGAGSVGALTVVATGTDPLRYQWRHNGTNLAGATNAALLFPSITATQAGNYTVTISNLAGGLTSAVATLTVSVADTDGDGLPDVWETAHGLNPNLHDAALDLDQDGMTNLQEFLAGTNPQDPNSYLQVADIIATPGACTLRFAAVSNRTYSVLYNPSLIGGAWQNLTNLPAHPTNRLATVLDPSPGATNRFYRLTTPSIP